MPRPTSGTTIQRPDLGAIAFEYMLEASRRGFIGLEILPLFDVMEQSADYPFIPIEAMLKLQDTKRAARGNYNRSDYEFETKTYACKEHGWEEPVDDKEAELYRRFFDAEEIAVLRATDIILRNHEKRVADKVFNSSNITNGASVTNEWDDATNATPRSDVFGGRNALRLATGVVVDSMAISATVLNNLLLTAEVREALKYTNPLEMGSMEQQVAQLSQYFGLTLLVGGAQYDSTAKGQSFTLAELWDDEYCLLFKMARSMDLKDPALGRTFLWTADSPDILTTEQYREEQTRSNVYRARHNVDERLTAAGAGYLLENITS